MKNIKDRINSQLFKAQEVELKAERIELTLIDDIWDGIRASQEISKKNQSVFNEANSMLSEQRIRMQKSVKQLKKYQGAFLAAAKELGINGTNNENYKMSVKVIDEQEQKIKILDKAISALK